MKQKMIKKIGYAVIPAAFALMGSTAQAVTATGNATATILTPLAISETTAMSFGDVYAEAGAVTVILDTAGARAGTATVGATAGAAGVFSVMGQVSTGYTISAIADTTLTGPGAAMSVTGFNHDAGGAPALDATGNATFNVGATLNVNAGQTPGAYAGTYSVEVLY